MNVQTPLLTAEQAAAYLLLDADRGSALAVKALNRLVDSRQVRPCIVGKHRRYLRDELDRFLRDRTQRYGELHQ